MTLDEAIERELYRTEANREMADSFHTDENIYSKEEEAFRNREDYHSQLAEWLKELKEHREVLDELKDEIKRAFDDLIESENEYGENARYTENDRGYLGGLLHAYEMFGREYEEVNADECNL